MSKNMKIGFKIKLSSETSEKLRQDGLEANDNKERVNDQSEKELSDFESTDISEVKYPGNPDEKNEILVKPVEFENEQPVSNTEKVKDLNTQFKNVDDTSLKDSEKQQNVDVKKLTDTLDKNAASFDESEDNINETNEGSEKHYLKDYAKYIHYEGDVAIYTDPSTNVEYIWCSEKNEWMPKSMNQNYNQEINSENIKYENGVATYIDNDGTTFIWDNNKNAWFPKVDDDFLAQYQMSYGFVDNLQNKEEETEKKEISEQTENKEDGKGLKRKNQEPPKWFDISDDQNTSVYVSNLPLDIDEEEFVELMQKCGIVMRDPTTQKMKIKLYTKPNSKQLKGDALCTYIKIESVELALNILDGYTYKNHRLHVEKAHFQMKGDYNPALKPKKKRRKEKDKIKKMQEKLFDWRPEKFRGERSKHEKVVIIKNLFEPNIFDKEVQLILEYQQDLREECAKLGEVRKVCLFDRHPEGVAQIIMKEPEEADEVVKLLNGRWFGKRQLKAEIWDGKTKYKMEETDADLNKRLGSWESFLEEKDGKKPGKDCEKKEEFKVPKPPIS